MSAKNALNGVVKKLNPFKGGNVKLSTPKHQAFKNVRLTRSRWWYGNLPIIPWEPRSLVTQVDTGPKQESCRALEALPILQPTFQQPMFQAFTNPNNLIQAVKDPLFETDKRPGVGKEFTSDLRCPDKARKTQVQMKMVRTKGSKSCQDKSPKNALKGVVKKLNPFKDKKVKSCTPKLQAFKNVCPTPMYWNPLNPPWETRRLVTPVNPGSKQKASRGLEALPIHQPTFQLPMSLAFTNPKNLIQAVKDPLFKTGKRPIVIDGSNVAFAHSVAIGKGPRFSSLGVKTCVEFFINRGHHVTVFVQRVQQYQARKF